jgi:hypothetical protein
MRISRQASQVQMMDQKQLDYVEYFNCLSSMITNDARCTGKRDIKCRIVMAKASFSNKKTFFASKLDLNLRKLHLKHSFVWC